MYMDIIVKSVQIAVNGKKTNKMGSGLEHNSD